MANNKFCTECGQRLEEGVKFCPNCGNDESRKERVGQICLNCKGKMAQKCIFYLVLDGFLL